MRYVTFDEVDHCVPYKSEARYAIDWSTSAEQKYKEPIRGIRVYESGVIKVYQSGYRDPRWRYTVREQFDLDFRLKSELSGLAFYDPDTGLWVPKKAIHTDILLLDVDLRRVYAIGGWGSPSALRFVSANAQPMGGSHVTYFRRNKETEKRRLEFFAPYFELGRTLNALDSNMGDTWLGYGLRSILEGKEPIHKDMQLPDVQQKSATMAKCEKQAKQLIIEGSRDVFSPNYLTIKEI